MQELQKLLEHAYRTVPYYRKVFDERGLTPRSIQDFSDLQQLPLLTKEVIRDNLPDLQSTAFKRQAFIKRTTGGSSGNSLGFYWQAGYSSERENAFTAALWDRAGFRYGTDKRLVLRGPVVRGNSFMEYRPVSKELVCSTYHMDKDHMLEYSRKMRQERIRFIHGHVSSIALLAQFVLDAGLSHSLNAVLGASEQVFPFQRRLVQEAFSTRIFSFYGQSEQVVMAGECEVSDQYHVFPEYGITQLVSSSGDPICSPGQKGEIVGTSFNNYAMPFIRYRTGDIGEYLAGWCECGRAYRLLRVEGRSYEYVLTADGRPVSLTGLIFGQHFNAFERIKKMQLYQDAPGQVVIRVVKTPTYSSEDEHEIRAVIQGAVRSGLELEFEYPDDILPSQSGKHRFLIQKLAHTFVGER